MVHMLLLTLVWTARAEKREFILAPLITIFPIISSLIHSYKRRDFSALTRHHVELQQCPAIGAGIVFMVKYPVGTCVQIDKEDESDSATLELHC
jgi:hypothetical protein